MTKKNQDILIRLSELLESNRKKLAQHNSDDVNTSLQTNLDNVDRAIATLRSYAKMKAKNPANGGVAIYSCYNDPTLGVFGMTLAPAILAGDNNMDIVIAFPSILKTYARFVEQLLTESQLLPNCKVCIGMKDFFVEINQSESIKHAVIFGDDWIKKHIDQFRKQRISLTYYGPGNNAAIILPGADLDKTARQIFDSAFILSGQAAVCINRCIVDNRIDEDEIKTVFSRHLKTISAGTGIENYVTPITIPPLVDQVKERVNKLNAQFLNIEETEKGWLIQPSVIYIDSLNTELFKEYHFAPVLPVSFCNYSNIAKEISSSDFGLYASIYGEPDQVEELENEIKQQHILILKNQSILEVLNTENGYIGPWGGYKKSGFFMGASTNWEPKGGAYSILNTITE